MRIIHPKASANSRLPMTETVLALQDKNGVIRTDTDIEVGLPPRLGDVLEDIEVGLPGEVIDQVWLMTAPVVKTGHAFLLRPNFILQVDGRLTSGHHFAPPVQEAVRLPRGFCTGKHRLTRDSAQEAFE